MSRTDLHYPDLTSNTPPTSSTIPLSQHIHTHIFHNHHNLGHPHHPNQKSPYPSTSTSPTPTMSRKRTKPSSSVTSDEEDDLSVKYSRRPETDQPVLGLDNTSLDTGHLPLQPVEDRMLSDSLRPLDPSDSCIVSDLLLAHTTATNPEVELDYELDTDQFADPASDLGLDYQVLSGNLLDSDSSDQGVEDMEDHSLPDMGGTLNKTTCSTPRRPNTSQNLSVICDICNRVYSNKYNLGVHKRTFHNIPKPGFPCPYCNKICKKSTALNIHIQKKHPGAKLDTSIPVRAKPQSTPSRLPKPLSETQVMVSQQRPVSPSSRVSATSVAPVSSTSFTSASGTSLISVSPSTAASPEKRILGRKHSECNMQASGTTPKQLPEETSGLASRDSSEPPSAVPSRSVSATSVASSSGSDYSARLGRFVCTHCDEMPFTRKYYLELHLKNFHGLQTTTLKTCEICKGDFSNQYTLGKHMRRAHPADYVPELESWECEICKKVYSDKYLLERHKQRKHNIQISGVPCPHCGKIYKESTGLNIHIAKKHPGL